MVKSFRFTRTIQFAHNFSNCFVLSSKIIIPFRKSLKIVDIENNYQEIINEREIEIDNVLIKREYLSETGNSSVFRIYANNPIVTKVMIRTDVSLLNRILPYNLNNDNEFIVGYNYYNINYIDYAYFKYAKEVKAFDKNLNETIVYKLRLNNRAIYLYKLERPLLIQLNRNTFFNIKDNSYIITDETEPTTSWFENWDY